MTDGEYRWVKQYLIQQVFDLENRNIVLAGVNVEVNVHIHTCKNNIFVLAIKNLLN